ncbi:hypothetical protein BDN70DRAFT_900348 [Pholiota conissans]|uniref:Uncharacterized protein n=1 Tax=Pholiota conissans TaxID=109636 RepID=A0A9P6CUL1_9AGAR|nr:hypothetical protein BDN70DRAFT_900348 [Pholiota conissans]
MRLAVYAPAVQTVAPAYTPTVVTRQGHPLAGHIPFHSHLACTSGSANEFAKAGSYAVAHRNDLLLGMNLHSHQRGMDKLMGDGLGYDHPGGPTMAAAHGRCGLEVGQGGMKEGGGVVLKRAGWCAAGGVNRAVGEGMCFTLEILKGEGIQTQLASAIEGLVAVVRVAKVMGKNFEFARNVHFGISPSNSHQKAINTAITGIIDATLP